jgi:hypothetical protein
VSWDSEALRIPATAYAQTLGASHFKKMRLLIAILILGTGLNSLGQENRPFSNLKEFKTKYSFMDIRVLYNEKTAKLYNKKLEDLDKNHPLYAADGCETEMLLILTTKIDNTDKEYAIIYGTCPEPEFTIYDAKDLGKHYGDVSGLELIVPGNGFLYGKGHVNSNFNLTQKYKMENGTLTEIKQPYYFVGLKTKTLRPLKLYSDKTEKEIVAELPTGYEIEILLAESGYDQESFYLAKTPFGLIGWLKIKAGQYKSIDVEGIFWNGD